VEPIDITVGSLLAHRFNMEEANSHLDIFPTTPMQWKQLRLKRSGGIADVVDACTPHAESCTTRHVEGGMVACFMAS
jgi:hypothetical protein